MGVQGIRERAVRLGVAPDVRVLVVVPRVLVPGS